MKEKWKLWTEKSKKHQYILIVLVDYYWIYNNYKIT